MAYEVFVNLVLVASVFSLDKNAINLSIEYFNYRQVNFVCLLSCERNNYWSHQFAKSTSLQLIAVSRVKTDETVDHRELSICLNQTFTSIGVFVDSRCSRFEEVMNYASVKMMFDSMHKWLIMDDKPQVVDFQNDTGNNVDDNFTIDLDTSESVAIVGSLNTSVDSDIILGFSKGYFIYDLYEAYNIGKLQGGNLKVEHVGSWNNYTGLNMFKNLNNYKYYNRWDFQQLAMRMIVVYSNPPEYFDPELIIGRVRPPGVAMITQTASMVLHVIAEIHNFRYKYTIADRWIGPYKPNNTMVVSSALYYGYQDISPVIRMSSYIWGQIDIVHPPLSSIETRYYYRIPTFGPGKFENQFLRPLTTGSWFCVMLVIALCAIALLLAARLEQRPMSAQYAAFSVIASLCQQFFDDSANSMRKSSQARQIAVFVTGLFCVLIYNYYTSSVVSWLLNGPPPSINSLEELLESPLQLIYEDIGYSRSWLQTPGYYYNKKNAKVEDDMRQKKVFNKKKGAPLLLSADEGIEMVKAGGYAYHTEVNTANMLISRKFNQMELCEMGSLQSMEKTVLFPAIQKNSPYKEFLVWSAARLVERGVVSCIQQRTRSEAVSCEGSSPRALALGGAAPAFLLLAFGYLLATVILILERSVHRYKHKPLKCTEVL